MLCASREYCAKAHPTGKLRKPDASCHERIRCTGPPDPVQPRRRLRLQDRARRAARHARAARVGVLPKQLLVGTETSDDAAVYQLNDTQAIVATTDFFMPIVDDPFDFGRIAATNAISDVYAMGGTPLFALALVGMPINSCRWRPFAASSRAANRSARRRASRSPAATASTRWSRSTGWSRSVSCIRRASSATRGAKPGDVLILGKPLGVGIYSAALKKGELDAAGYAAMIASTTKLNTPGIAACELSGVHALTDVTGFGLLGHLLEVCRGSNVRR